MKSKRNGDVDLLRFIFSTIIVLHHFNSNYNMGIFTNVICGDFFFLLIGFFMAKHVERKNEDHHDLCYVANETWHYLINKLKPLYKYYISAFLLQIIVRCILIRHDSIGKIIKSLLGSIPTLTLTFMGLNNSAKYLYVGNTWFLSAMLIAIIILFPLLVRNYNFSVKVLFPIISLFVLGYLFETNHSITKEVWTGIIHTCVLRAIAEIALGGCICCLSSLIKEKNVWLVRTEKKSLIIILTCFKVLCYAVVVVFAYGSVFGKTIKSSFNLHALLFCSIGLLFSLSNIGYSIRDSKITRYLGKLSLPIFIFHGVIRWAYWDITGKIEISVLMYVTLVIMTIIASVAMMYLTDFVVARLKPLAKKIVE